MWPFWGLLEGVYRITGETVPLQARADGLALGGRPFCQLRVQATPKHGGAYALLMFFVNSYCPVCFFTVRF